MSMTTYLNARLFEYEWSGANVQALAATVPLYCSISIDRTYEKQDESERERERERERVCMSVVSF
jgi:hypothetical protein